MGTQLLVPKGAQPPILGPYLLWPTAGSIKMPLGTEVDLGPGDIVGTPPPSPKKGGHITPNFDPCIVATRMEVGLGLGDFVLDGDPAAPSPKGGGQSHLHNFSPFLLWPNSCMHQHATWYGGRPQPRGLCVRWEPSPLNFRPVYYSYCDFFRTLHNAQSLLVYSSSSSSFSILCILFFKV